ncbi:TetR/AcrR family transcriptional regulator [Georgenia sp. Z1491]|uniref:TetR/AcrR family transcriptional regulator n=1 Tax=Georgenia sp. Z1491 TaxID=3416707 RepID=UPI003CEDC09D
MPKIVDHGARREEVTRAALELVARGGRRAATVRALADATGWSAGAVRHYVPSTAALESLMLEHVAGQVQRRVGDVVRNGRNDGLDPVELVAHMVEQILPLDAERDAEHRIWLALYVDPGIAAEELSWAWTGKRMFHRQLVLLLAGAETVPDYPEELPREQERLAGHLHAFIDGLALRLASGWVEPRPPQEDLRDMLRVLAARSVELGKVSSAPSPAQG